MTQFPSVFQNALSDVNQSNAQQPQMSQANYPQPMQTKPIASFNQQSNYTYQSDSYTLLVHFVIYDLRCV